jgi:hypothetical protein
VTTKLDQEPNPFEQSFSGAPSSSNPNEAAGSKTPTKPVLPPAASIASPNTGVLSKGIFPKDMTEQFAWDSLRSGPLSPSMLQKPADPTFAVDGEQLGTNNGIGSISNVPGAFSFQGMTSNPLYGTSGNPQAATQYQGKVILIFCERYLLWDVTIEKDQKNFFLSPPPPYSPCIVFKHKLLSWLPPPKSIIVQKKDPFYLPLLFFLFSLHFTHWLPSLAITLFLHRLLPWRY